MAPDIDPTTANSMTPGGATAAALPAVAITAGAAPATAPIAGNPAELPQSGEPAQAIEDGIVTALAAPEHAVAAPLADGPILRGAAASTTGQPNQAPSTPWTISTPKVRLRYPYAIWVDLTLERKGPFDAEGRALEEVRIKQTAMIVEAMKATAEFAKIRHLLERASANAVELAKQERLAVRCTLDNRQALASKKEVLPVAVKFGKIAAKMTAAKNAIQDLEVARLHFENELADARQKFEEKLVAVADTINTAEKKANRDRQYQTLAEICTIIGPLLERNVIQEQADHYLARDNEEVEVARTMLAAELADPKKAEPPQGGSCIHDT
jgi:hypothetical protein